MDAVATPPRALPPRALPSRLAAGLVFLSSGAVLVLEIVGLRLVGPYVGVTLETSSAVIGTALAAIAYGAWTGGNLADRYPPRRLLPPALLLAALATALSLPVVRWAGEWLRGSAAPGTLLLTMLALFLPAGLLSAVTPLVIKLQLADLDRTGQVVGRLSGIGTLGAITATLGTGFVLVAALPSSVIILAVAGVLALTGLWLGLHFQREVRRERARSTPLTAVVAVVAGLLTTIAPDPCDIETAYHCATVTEDPNRPGGRVLWLNSARHSYVDLDEPRHLEFAYAQWLGAVVDVIAPPAEPIHALHLGGGGFTLPGYVAATRPGSANHVIEIDGALVRLDRERLGLRPDIGVTVGDARVGLAGRPDGAADLVIGDAFGHLSVPWHLTTREMVTDIRRTLRPGGWYAQNIIDYPPGRFIRAELATVAAVFEEVALIAPADAIAGRRGANFVLLAATTPLPLTAVRERLPTGDDGAIILSGPELAAFIGDAEVLTDDHAPVDQLLARG